MNTTRLKPNARKLLPDMVRDRLRQSLLMGVFPPGSKLPTEDELAERYQVSRMTLREGVRGLVEEGFLTRQAGVGTYVTRRPRVVNNLDLNFGVTHMIQNLGMQPGVRDVRVRQELPVRKVSRALAIAPEEPVAVLERVRTADGQPIVYSVEYMPKAILVNGIEELERLSGSLYNLMARLGHPIHHGVATIKPALADSKLAHDLLVEEGSLLLHLEQTDYSENDQPQLFSLEWYTAEESTFSIYRKGSGSETSY
jgi:GntR family transcriptional regulator